MAKFQVRLVESILPDGTGTKGSEWKSVEHTFDAYTASEDFVSEWCDGEPGEYRVEVLVANGKTQFITIHAYSVITVESEDTFLHHPFGPNGERVK